MVSWSERVYLPTCRGATLQLTDDIFLARFFRAFFFHVPRTLHAHTRGDRDITSI